MTGVHESTVAKSVYEALQRLGSTTPEQIFMVLQKIWMSTIELSEVRRGIEILTERGFVAVADGTIAATRLRDGVAATVIRNPHRETELIYAVKQ